MMQESLRASPPLPDTDSDTPFYATNGYKFTAYFGDLLHKQDVAAHFGVVNERTQRFLSNEHQAQWLRDHFPNLIPEPSQPGQDHSTHTLGTIFEWNYQSNQSFRHIYLACLPTTLDSSVTAKILVWGATHGRLSLARELIEFLASEDPTLDVPSGGN